MPMNRPERGLAVVRVAVAATMFVHGVARIAAGGVVPFGGFLEAKGFPAGVALAIAVTAFEVLAAPLLAAGRFTRPLAAAFAAELVAGIVLVHAPEGWFVVGLGRNGAEYSAVLVACLVAVIVGSPGALPSRVLPRSSRA